MLQIDAPPQKLATGHKARHTRAATRLYAQGGEQLHS